jgi:hypothetical protein
MGMDAYAVAAWGLRTTWGKIELTFTKTRRWVGPADGDRSFEFDPKTGKPNFVEDVAEPAAVMLWEPISLGSDDRRFDDEYIIPVVLVRTKSHRARPVPAKVAPEVSADRMESFKADMTKVGLWNEESYGLWLFLDISV